MAVYIAFCKRLPGLIKYILFFIYESVGAYLAQGYVNIGYLYWCFVHLVGSGIDQS